MATLELRRGRASRASLRATSLPELPAPGVTGPRRAAHAPPRLGSPAQGGRPTHRRTPEACARRTSHAPANPGSGARRASHAAPYPRGPAHGGRPRPGVARALGRTAPAGLPARPGERIDAGERRRPARPSRSFRHAGADPGFKAGPARCPAAPELPEAMLCALLPEAMLCAFRKRSGSSCCAFRGRSVSYSGERPERGPAVREDEGWGARRRAARRVAVPQGSGRAAPYRWNGGQRGAAPMGGCGVSGGRGGFPVAPECGSGPVDLGAFRQRGGDAGEVGLHGGHPRGALVP